MKEKQKGGKRKGAGRRPSETRKDPVTVYTDVSKFGGKAGARMAIYEFLNGKITNTERKSFISLDEKVFTPSDREIKQKATKEKKRPLVTDLTKSAGVLNPQEPPKTNYSIDPAPKTLDELKKLCPAELTGFDKSNWVATERQKYGI